MCGISGILARNADDQIPSLEQRVGAMLRSMAHRGPHGSSLLSRPGMIMASNRLAVRGIDEGHPPLIEYDDGIMVVCNGEIDNYRELSRSLEASGHSVPLATDVSVIAPLYLEKGLAALDHLQGVFALALWDPRLQRLILARDRVGERHLYYGFCDGVLHFASELAALLACRRVAAEVDPDSLARFLRSGYCPAPGTLLTGCQKVCPGEVIIVDPSGTRRQQYWNCPIGRAERRKPSRQSFDRVFRNAVERQSDVDADYGVLLSGGVDSALMTAVARSVRPEKKLSAYCIAFEETSFDESRHAARLAGDLGCEFVPVTVSSGDFPVVLHDLIKMTGEPLADPAWIPLAQVARRASKDVRVLLSGEGADELFAGYPTYLGASLASRYAHLPPTARAAIRYFVERIPASDRNVTVSFLLKRFVQGEDKGGLARHLLWTAAVPPAWLRRLGIEPPPDRIEQDPAILIDAIQRYDFENSLPEALMAKADRGAMCHGVEIRAPFLDQTVIEFAASLPVEARIRGLTTKVFLKRYASSYLPRRVVHRRKRGLSVPLASWLRGPLLDWARSRLASTALSEAGIDNRVALQLLSEHCARLGDHSRAIWPLIVLSEWLEWHRSLPTASTR